MNTVTDQKYLVEGIADKKQAEIDSLTNQVTVAQFSVIEKQVIVNSLIAKSTQFNTYLTQADANQATALSNLNLSTDALANVKSLVATLVQAQKQTSLAQSGASNVAAQVSVLIDKLIFTIEIIDKLGLLITKQKAINPLIPDSLISFMAKANKDASNAIALTLTALQSCYAAEASLLESQNTIDLGSKQGNELFARMVNNYNQRMQAPNNKLAVVGLTSDCDGIMALLQRAYKTASAFYDDALWSNNSVTRQLNFAQGELAGAITASNSYKAGLAAATAAAYAA